MEAYERMNIQEMPLSSPFFRRMVERFLEANGLRMEELDVYLTIQDAEGSILAGAGLSRDIIKCVAVAQEARSEGLMGPLVSALVALAARQGIHQLKVFTKPEYQSIFESLGFHLLAQAPLAILLENGRGLEQYCAGLRCLAGQSEGSRIGVIIMNANPFTRGHQYLLEKAADQVDKLFVIPVKEDASAFLYSERKAMTEAGAGSSVVVEGSDYQISAATFPTYFLKDLSDASETQMRLDLDLFARHIAPALGATVRFVGSEPQDPLTAKYNALMKAMLPSRGIQVVEIPRLESISASVVRSALEEGDYATASAMVPVTSQPYLLAFLAERALRLELDTPMKPGLVGPDGPGAHKDMDYGTMQRGIASLRPFWSRMALASSADELRQAGIDAEKAMLAATGGVNTHRGAIFALGLVLHAAFQRGAQSAANQLLLQKWVHREVHRLFGKSLNDKELRSSASGATDVKGALAMADDGYRDLFEDWLTFYRKIRHENTAKQALLLRIMSTLDDTCVIKRVGKDRAELVKQEAKAVLEDYTEEKLKTLCDRYASEGISPGGAADMLALTIFTDSIL